MTSLLSYERIGKRLNDTQYKYRLFCVVPRSGCCTLRLFQKDAPEGKRQPLASTRDMPYQLLGSEKKGRR
jgi:hypothetical protein